MPFNSYAFKQIGNLGSELSAETGDPLVTDRTPYLKYQFVAQITLDDANREPPGNQDTFKGNDTSREDTSSQFTLKTFELPRWTIDSQVINQYNHKSVIQTKMNFEPITISFYDQQNDAVEAFISDVVKGQFDATDGSKNLSHRPMTIKVHMQQTSDGGLRDDLDADIFTGKTYELFNCYIVDAQHDTLDYSASDVVLWTLSIRYEFMDWYESENKNFSNFNDGHDSHYIRQFPENKAPEGIKVPKKEADPPAKKVTKKVVKERETVFNNQKLSGQESKEIIDAKKDKIKASQAVNKIDLDPSANAEEVLLKRLDNSNGKQILQAVNRKTRRSLSPSEAADVARIVRMQDDKLGAGVLEAQRNKLSPDSKKALQQINSSQNKSLRENIQKKDNILRTTRARSLGQL